MTEDQWNSCTDPQAMLAFLRASGRLSERKARLFAVACCRRIWPLLKDQRSRRAVEVAERYAEKLVAVDEMKEGGTGADDARKAIDLQGNVDPVTEAAVYAAYAAACSVWIPTEGEDKWPLIVSAYSVGATTWAADDTFPEDYPLRLSTQRTEETALANLLRDIFGPLPFRPVLLPPNVRTWNEGCVVKLATAIYEERSLPEGTLDAGNGGILGDALEEAGVTDRDILGHLREPGAVHVRGCCLVDLLLGKE